MSERRGEKIDMYERDNKRRQAMSRREKSNDVMIASTWQTEPSRAKLVSVK